MTLWLLSDVDVEFDALRHNQLSPSSENPGLTEGLPLLLDFFHRHGIRATFHMQEQRNHAMSIIERYPELYDMLDDYAQEVSLHVHVKDDSYSARKEEIGAGFQRLRDQGYNINSFRAGWYFTNENTVKVLEELEIKYDASPLKGVTVGSKKFFHIPDSPYHPSYSDITRLGKARTLVIPVTDFRLGIGIHRDDEKEKKLIAQGIDMLAGKAEEREEPVIVYFTTHSWKPLSPGGKQRGWEEKHREYFITCLENYDYRSLSVGEAGALWEKRGYMPYSLNLPPRGLSAYPWHNPRRYDFIRRHILSNLHILRYRLYGKL